MKKYFQTKYLSSAVCIVAAIIIIASCKKDVVVTPSFAVTPSSAAGNEVVTLTGSNLSGIQSVVFDLGNVPAAFNPVFNTDSAVLFRVPPTANVGLQHIVFTNANGYQFSVPFTVLAIPSLTSAYPAEWEAANTVTISGNYLQSVYHVGFTASSDTAIIISASPTQLILQMPASTVPSTSLVISNDAGSTTSSFSLVNMDQQLKLFTEGYGIDAGVQDWSWSVSSVSTDYAVSGTTSLKEVFGKGGYAGLSFHTNDAMVLTNYQNISFWVKGGTDDNAITVAADAVVSGPGGKTSNIAVPANVWTYITVPMSTFGATSCQRFDVQIVGPANSDQTLYFDNVILQKQ